MAEKDTSNVVFTLAGGSDWSAGALFYSNVIRALRSLAPQRNFRVAFIMQDDQSLKMQHGDLLALADKVITFNPTPHSLTRAGRILKNYANRLNSPMNKALDEFGTDCLFTTHLPENWAVPHIPVISWIPDFQHKRMPELFSAEELASRDSQFSFLAKHSAKLVVTSQDVSDDVGKFYPEIKGRCHVLKFATSIPAQMLKQDPAEIARLYNLPARFFLLPNQFWKHKNHTLVLHALARALKERPDLAVVATGNMRDYRHPHFMDELLQESSKLGLRNNFIVLGLVIREHLFALMRRSIAVLQPSLFEGLSMTVAESKVLGKQIIASDIAVHRELAPAGTVFFNPHDAEQLARLLSELDAAAEAHSLLSNNEIDFETALERAPHLVREFGDSIVKALS